MTGKYGGKRDVLRLDLFGLGFENAYRRPAGGPLHPQGGHHRAIWHFDLMSFASTRGTGTLRDHSRVLTDLVHGASQPKPATPIVAFFFRLPPGTKVPRESVDRASPDDPPPLLSDRSHKLASTALAFDQPVTDVRSVILYGPQAPPNKIWRLWKIAAPSTIPRPKSLSVFFFSLLKIATLVVSTNFRKGACIIMAHLRT